MQAWDSVLITADGDYKGTAGCVVSVDNDKKSVAVRLDADGMTKTFLQSEVQRLG